MAQCFTKAETTERSGEAKRASESLDGVDRDGRGLRVEIFYWLARGEVLDDGGEELFGEFLVAGCV
jgi:hypothetical protein